MYIVFWEEEDNDGNLTQIVERHATRDDALHSMQELFEEDGTRAELAQLVSVHFAISISIVEEAHAETESTAPTDVVRPDEAV